MTEGQMRGMRATDVIIAISFPPYAEETLRGAFWFDVRNAVREWRKSRNLPLDPLQEFRASGYMERIKAERSHRNAQGAASYA